MDKVRTRVMAKSEELLTNAENGLKVKITLKDGRVFEHTTGRADILGSQKNPWGFENIQAKFRVNAGMALPAEAVGAAVETWSDIAQVEDVTEAVRRTLANV
jgi:hypothetical protein